MKFNNKSSKMVKTNERVASKLMVKLLSLLMYFLLFFFFLKRPPTSCHVKRDTYCVVYDVCVLTTGHLTYLKSF